jgi:hypothetical protein
MGVDRFGCVAVEVAAGGGREPLVEDEAERGGAALLIEVPNPSFTMVVGISVAGCRALTVTPLSRSSAARSMVAMICASLLCR